MQTYLAGLFWTKEKSSDRHFEINMRNNLEIEIRSQVNAKWTVQAFLQIFLPKQILLFALNELQNSIFFNFYLITFRIKLP